jgi:hypothetical protein
MRKIDDFFFAGLVAGAIGGIGIMLLNVILLIIGIPHGTYWQAMGGLFYNKELLKTWPAQVHGAIDAIGISAANGVITCFILKYTGKDYLYIKSASLSAFSAYFLFVVVYPQTGLGKNSAITPWVALVGHTVFTGLFVGYILTKIYSFKREACGDQSDSKNIVKDHIKDTIHRKQLRYKLIYPPLTRIKGNKEENIVLKKPKKL